MYRTNSVDISLLYFEFCILNTKDLVPESADQILKGITHSLVQKRIANDLKLKLRKILAS
jgi:hypothetical protein